MRICLVYDHVYPVTVGGGERWMHDLALALARDGHEVTYLTMTHRDDAAQTLPGVRIVGLVPAGRVYDDDRRALGPPVRFGAAVARYLLRHGHRFDAVHTAAFPYFPLLGAALARRRHGYRLVVDWYEAWTRAYWRRYAGAVVGTAGWLVQRLCTRVAQDAFCISRHTAARLLEEGYSGPCTVLPGLYAGPVEPSRTGAVRAVVVFAGRHVREKRIPLLVEGFGHAKREIPELRLELFGDGPDRARTVSVATRLGLADSIDFRGRRTQAEVEESFAHAACVASASEREGYGLIVVEAAARSTPSVVVAGEENAAAELVKEGVNGAVADRATPESLGDGIVRVVRQGAALRDSTLRWFLDNAADLRIERSLELVTQAYRSADPTGRPPM